MLKGLDYSLGCKMEEYEKYKRDCDGTVFAILNYLMQLVFSQNKSEEVYIFNEILKV